MQYNDGYSDNILSFVNNVHTKDGEPTRQVWRTAITKAMNDYVQERQDFSRKDKIQQGSDYRGLSCSFIIGPSPFAN